MSKLQLENPYTTRLDPDRETLLSRYILLSYIKIEQLRILSTLQPEGKMQGASYLR